jgi:hypothetical protein
LPYVLAHGSGRGEWFSNLVHRIENHISLEEQKPINPELLPEYIDIDANVSTGRADFEEPYKMFKSHEAFDAERQAVESFEAASVVRTDKTKDLN